MQSDVALTKEAPALKPLSGIRVLDFTAFPPGAACTVMLADLGADVIRVEPPSQKGKPSLVIGQVALSRGKRSMTLDMRNPSANDVLLRLVRSVDVVVENAKPGSMEARGFGYSQARSANPKIIWCAMTGFGQSGPYAEHAGHDLSYVAHSGLLNALAPELPWHPATMIAGPAGAQAAVIAIQAALLELARTKEGAFLDISLSEATGWFLTSGMNALSDKPYKISASPDRRLYTCADGRFVAVTSAEPRTWRALCDGMGIPELKSALHQPDPNGEVTARLAGIFASRPAAEWVELLAPAGAAVAIVNCASEVPTDPHVLARGSVAECAGVKVPASPIRIEAASGARSATTTDAPHCVGDDTADILGMAGFSEDVVRTLLEQGII
ncbi:crotonobetainyl-CoA:carnitine CoA-transferase CaiB-like acyl-CoA transferase [Novosphingobium sp. PhB165]|uniref:CaiB/BaiF CoA transferase family protein n=1 Tax=Novosphingobium sp. PhB165 TaxID=2485105 RepID=UPI00104FB03A|nr:CaiB/BaiF CoA-transferase family protein [Novosphingobium sp. PhB165]TCM16590.1 crotonobetainyl-CoA:carnitine CoA-transferase CaiB-like acyl-CoA transferase [Novosphingobium sp. PhB165]